MAPFEYKPTHTRSGLLIIYTDFWPEFCVDQELKNEKSPKHTPLYVPPPLHMQGRKQYRK